jgi:3-hydroxyacyl-[acyl-carrier-protein] dehydratase
MRVSDNRGGGINPEGRPGQFEYFNILRNMRFLYYDKIDHIEKGTSINGVKTFTLSEEFFRKHFTKQALVPGVIYIEAMAQLLGWLIIYSHDFKLSAIMSLVEDVNVTSKLRPGFKADIHGEIISTSRRDSLGRAWISVDGEIVASMNRIIYSHVHKVNSDDLKKLFCYYSGMKM